MNEPFACLYDKRSISSEGTMKLREPRTCTQLSLFSLVRAPNETPSCVSAWRMMSAMALVGGKTSSVSAPRKTNQKYVRFQVRRAQFSAVCASELHLKEPVVANENDVVVCGRIEFVGGVRGSIGVSTRVESERDETIRERMSNEHTASLMSLTTICTNPCRAVRHELSRAPVGR